MIKINPQPEACPEIIMPYQRETLQKLLFRKSIAKYRYDIVMYNKAKEEKK